jgi:hypothetical protein
VYYVRTWFDALRDAVGLEAAFGLIMIVVAAVIYRVLSR